VLQSIADWSARREGLVLRNGLTLLAFPDPASRDRYLGSNPGSACGDCFAIAPDRAKKPQLAGALACDHAGPQRRTLELDEHGHLQTEEPLDLVQAARLRRVAEDGESGWRLTRDSVRRAAASSYKAARIHLWLQDHLRHPAPPLIARAIDAWLGREDPVELAEVVVLHVPDEGQFQAIAESERLELFLGGSPGPGWLVVKKTTVEEFTAVLEELGFAIGRQLTFDALTEPENVDPEFKRRMILAIQKSRRR
jgi:hypothetical protein